MFRTAFLPLLLAACLVAANTATTAAETKSSRRAVADKSARPTPAVRPVQVMSIEEDEVETACTQAPVERLPTDDANKADEPAETPDAAPPDDSAPTDTPVPEPPQLPNRTNASTDDSNDDSADEMESDEEPQLQSIDPPTLTEPTRRPVPPIVPPPPAPIQPSAPIQPPANRVPPRAPVGPAPAFAPPRATPPLPPPAAAEDEAATGDEEPSASDAPETVATPNANDYGKAHFRSDLHSMLHGCCLPGFYAGFEMTFLAPLDDPCPVVTLTDLVSGDAYVSDVDPGLGIGFRTWVGFQNPNAFGFRVSYWNLGSYLTQPDPVVPKEDKTATLGAYYLNAQTLYFELLNSFCCGHGGYLDVSFGAAYARMERNATALGYGQAGDEGGPTVKLYGLANCADSLEGMGFTGSIGGRHRFWCGCENFDEFGGACGPGGWNFFWNLRGTVIWAESQVYGRTETHAYTDKFGGSTAYTTNSAFACSDGDTIGIGEMQLGIAYQRCLTCCPGILTMRLALEGQYWGTAPISAVSDSTAYLIGGPPLFGGEANAMVNAESGGLSLLGVTFGVCLSF